MRKKAQKSLSELQKHLNTLIDKSGIRGIVMNYGPFNNPLKQVHVLQRLQNTIKVLEREKITDINGIYDYEHGTLLDSWQATDFGHDPINILEAAIYAENLEVVQALIDGGVDLDVKNSYGNTPLHIAISYGRTSIVRALIAAGSNLENNSNFRGVTPLHVATENGYIAIVNVLITSGANLESENIVRITPLFLAIGRGYTAIVKALITAGANINHKMLYGKSPLDYAAKEGRTEILKTLLAAGVDISTYDGDNELVLNVQKIERGENADVDFDLLFDRFIAIMKQDERQIVATDSGNINISSLKDLCWDEVVAHWNMRDYISCSEHAHL